MALPASGNAISFADLRTEYNTGSNTAISFADYRRGGSLVRAKASNNNGVNLSANVPTGTTISLGDFYSQERGFQKTFSSNDSDQNVATIFGDDYAVDYPKRLVIDNGITVSGTQAVDAIKYPSGASGTLTILNNGTITWSGAYGINNLSSVTVAVTNNGSVSGSNTETFNSTFSGNGSAKMDFIGGQGGASCPDIYHSDYGGYGNFNCKLTRSGNTFTASWTYNELYYADQGGGSVDCTGIFPLNGSGELDITNTSEYVINTSVGGYYGGDIRTFGFGSQVINGQRHFWFASNCKPTTMTLGSSMTWSQPGWITRYLTTSNSRRSSILTTQTGADTNGDVTGIS
tara:strand:+ start:5119 stop:6153 length:1035 start_codon:yes stop_codon:yes gene_type:complete